METEGSHKRVLRVFVASPGDVPEERKKAQEILLALNRHPHYGKSCVLEPYLWDDPHAPTPLSFQTTPEDSVVHYGERPARCDLLIAILKHRLGSPLPTDSHGRSSEGEPYTGTEWEILDAVEGDGSRTEEVFVFVAQEPFSLPRGLPSAERQERQSQYESVERFLERLQRHDGSYRGGVNFYEDTEDFTTRLRGALERWLEKRLTKEASAPHEAQKAALPRARAGVPPSEPPLLSFRVDAQGEELRTHLTTSSCSSPATAVLSERRALDARIAAHEFDALLEALFGADPLRGFRGMVQDCLGAEAPDGLASLPLRVRLVAPDPVLAALPWHCLSHGERPLGDAGWVMESVHATQPEPLPVLEIPIENPLILAPSDPTLEIGAARHVSEVQDALRALLGGPGQAITWTRTRRELEFHLRQDPPDLIYCFTLLDAQGALALGRSESDRHTLDLNELARLLEQARTRPVLWMSLIASARPRTTWHALLPHCHLLLAQQTDIIRVEAASERNLAWLERLQEGLRDPCSLVSDHPDPRVTLIHSSAPVRLRLPAAEAETGAGLRARIRATLLRILLGREPEKNMLYGYTQGASDGDLLAYVAVGDEQACVHDFPAQVRHRLEQTLEDGIRVVTQFVPASLGTSPEPDLEIGRLFKRHLLPAGGSLGEALEGLLRHPPLEDESVVIALPWLLDLGAETSEVQVEQWIESWARLHAQAFAGTIPERCRVLLGACIRLEQPCPLAPEQVLGCANAALGRAAAEASPGFEPVKLGKPLGRLSADHLHRFYTQSRFGPRLLPSRLDARRLAQWIVSQTDGAFSDTVDLVYGEYRDGYSRFQKHERNP
jgi:hypothetical protein